jgi:alpha-amylase/alpha-mannosidase (GH57 family)
MSRLGEEAIRVVITKLSPHLEKASAMLAFFPIFEKREEMEPEQRLEEYLRQKVWRRKMGYYEPEFPTERQDSENIDELVRYIEQTYATIQYKDEEDKPIKRIHEWDQEECLCEDNYQ